MNLFQSNKITTSGAYRPDIDGLRAWAVISVILYHFGVGIFKGGFIGVDIFFVISGYLITKGILSQLEKNKFSIKDFYARRVRRLFPALFATILITYVVCYFILSPADFMALSGSAVYAITGISNIYFWMGSGYFDQFASLKPLLHTWSLSVELQFYLVWPFLIILLSKGGKNIVAVGIVLFVVAMSAVSVMQAKSDSTSAFFMTQYRMHEFAIGGIAVLAEKVNLSKLIKTIIYSVGLILVSIPVFTYDISSINFPGYFSIIPCIGSAFLIISGSDIYLSRILSNKIASKVGEISYSMYLVHWPVFVFFNYFMLGNINAWTIFLMLFLTIIFSSILYVLIEKPLRNPINIKISSTSFSLVCSLCTIIIVVIASSSWAGKGWEWRFNGEMKKITSIPMADAQDFTWKKQRELAARTDFEKSVDKPKLLILGDSQSADIINMLNESGYIDKYDIVARNVYAQCGTIYVPSAEEDVYYTSINKNTMNSPQLISDCKNQTNSAMNKRLLSESDIIIISLLYQEQSPAYIAKSVAAIKEITSNPIYLVGRKELKDNSANIVTRFGRISGVDVFAAKYFQEPWTDKINEQLKGIKGVNFIDIMSYVCPDNDYCNILTDNGMPTYYDTSHLTRYGAKYFGEKIFKDF
ncbi:acyltransferase [Escherichia coli]|nr:acyltransferase [Escherichia coli]